MGTARLPQRAGLCRAGRSPPEWNWWQYIKQFNLITDLGCLHFRKWWYRSAKHTRTLIATGEWDTRCQMYDGWCLEIELNSGVRYWWTFTSLNIVNLFMIMLVTLWGWIVIENTTPAGSRQTGAGCSPQSFLLCAECSMALFGWTDIPIITTSATC